MYVLLILEIKFVYNKQLIELEKENECSFTKPKIAFIESMCNDTLFVILFILIDIFKQNCR